MMGITAQVELTSALMVEVGDCPRCGGQVQGHGELGRCAVCGADLMRGDAGYIAIALPASAVIGRMLARVVLCGGEA